MKRWWNMLKSGFKGFGEDNAMTHAAAVSFYAALSFAPLVLLLVTIGGLLGESTRNDLVGYFEAQIGSQAGQITEQVVQQSQEQQQQGGTWWRWVVSIGVLFFSASAVFAQLQASLNRMWNVEAKPGQGAWGWIRKRLTSMGLILAILLILVVALVVSSVIGQLVPTGNAVVAQVVSEVISLGIFTVLFAAMFKILPDVKIEWSDVWVGALITAVLFTIGKLLISLYLQYGNVGESYGGAAASLIALVVWVYYSAIIVFLGAELTQAWTQSAGKPIAPDKHARRIEAPPPPGARPAHA